MRTLLLALLLVACGGAESSGPLPATDAGSDVRTSSFPCPSASVAAGSRFPNIVCDQQVPGMPMGTPRFTTVEDCAGSLYRPEAMPHPITTSRHPTPNACPGILLVTITDAGLAYVGT